MSQAFVIAGGYLNINKDQGWTSTDVVRKLKGITLSKKIIPEAAKDAKRTQEYIKSSIFLLTETIIDSGIIKNNCKDAIIIKIASGRW